MEPTAIVVKGAREHNLKNVSLTLPRNKLICFTGVSGSGKSSFAFDTLYAEGQRRYIESLSSYARQFMGQLPKPDVDLVAGLSPAISIQQKTSGWNPRSTVGTITQIHDFLRVLFARAGTQHCPQCGRPISAQTREQIVERILALAEGSNGSKRIILAPVVRGQKGEYRDLFEDMLKQGFARARVDGRIVQLSQDPRLDRNIRHDIEIVVDRIAVSRANRPRLAEAVEAALRIGDGTLVVAAIEATCRRSKGGGGGADLLLSSKYACTKCDVSFEPPSPQMFSFNSPAGMCMTCDGMGTRFDFDPDRLVPRPRRSFVGLAIEPMRTRIGRWRRHIYEGVARHVGFNLRTPWRDLPEKARRALLYGTGDAHLTFEWRWSGGVWQHGGTFTGVIAELREKHKKAKSPIIRAFYEKYMTKTVCPDCKGRRLNRQALAMRVGDLGPAEVSALSIEAAQAFFENLRLTPTKHVIAQEVLKEITARLAFLQDVGLGYLTLDRTAPTLSGGESQRIRLAGQIGSGLVGVLYVLDEPSVGLHARDNRRLLDSLERLRDMGNTVIIVEHDEETMRTADEIIDFGPGPGVRGGEVVVRGDIAKVTRSKKSITGAYLTGRREIPVPTQRRPVAPRKPRARKASARKTVASR
ncbi:MAG: excinuclease ABC subunit UvrA [Phycisphaerales bacterium]|nr:MAG: excinuclease ABC subunit UvrA [Phycisphaerales bacterium]